MKNLRNDWERLEKQDKDVTFYSTYMFLYFWWKSYQNNPNYELRIIYIENNNMVIAIAPLVLEKRHRFGISFKTLKFMGLGDYFTILLDSSSSTKKSLKRVMDCIDERKDEWDVVHLSHIQSQSMLSSYFLKNNKYNDKFQCLGECPTLRLNKYKSFEQYCKKELPSKVKQYKNNLFKKNNCNFKVEQNNQNLNKLAKIHIKQQEYMRNHKRKERRSLFENNFLFIFLSDVYSNMSENIITFSINDTRDNIICYNTCFRYKNMLHSWNSGHNSSYNLYRPGKVIYYEIFNYLFSNRTNEIFDFGTGRYWWKFEWTNNFTLNYTFRMYNQSSSKGKLIEFYYKILK